MRSMYMALRVARRFQTMQDLAVTLTPVLLKLLLHPSLKATTHTVDLLDEAITGVHHTPALFVKLVPALTKLMDRIVQTRTAHTVSFLLVVLCIWLS